MKISNKKRIYLADNITKVAQYIISIVILGQIVTNKINVSVLIVAGIIFVILIILGTILTPDNSEWE